MSSINASAFFKISYGLFVVTSFDGEGHNGLIVNTVMQLTSTPYKVSVCISKENYSHDVIKNTKIMNVNCLTESTPFDVFKRFGFQSGKDTDKFDGLSFKTAQNGCALLEENVNAHLCLRVTDYTDLGTHGLFICDVEEAETLSDEPSVTYTYYHENIKPKPEKTKKKGFVCKICGYVHEADTLPDDFICPICKHPASDFEEIE